MVTIKADDKDPIWDDIKKLMRESFLATGYEAHLREMVRKRKQGLYEGMANYIFVMMDMIERMDKDGHINEEERVQRILEGMVPQTEVSHNY